MPRITIVPRVLFNSFLKQKVEIKFVTRSVRSHVNNVEGDRVDDDDDDRRRLSDGSMLPLPPPPLSWLLSLCALITHFLILSTTFANDDSHAYILIICMP